MTIKFSKRLAVLIAITALGCHSRLGTQTITPALDMPALPEARPQGLAGGFQTQPSETGEQVFSWLAPQSHFESFDALDRLVVSFSLYVPKIDGAPSTLALDVAPMERDTIVFENGQIKVVDYVEQRIVAEGVGSYQPGTWSRVDVMVDVVGRRFRVGVNGQLSTTLPIHELNMPDGTGRYPTSVHLIAVNPKGVFNGYLDSISITRMTPGGSHLLYSSGFENGGQAPSPVSGRLRVMAAPE